MNKINNDEQLITEAYKKVYLKEQSTPLNKRSINYNHKYVYDDGVTDVFGDQMEGIDDYIGEMQFLLDELNKWRRKAQAVQKSPSPKSPSSGSRDDWAGAQGNEGTSSIPRGGYQGEW